MFHAIAIEISQSFEKFNQPKEELIQRIKESIINGIEGVKEIVGHSNRTQQMEGNLNDIEDKILAITNNKVTIKEK